ncbi:MAG: hypothetical protein ABEJ70_01365 [Halobacteriaceae archaeon]
MARVPVYSLSTLAVVVGLVVLVYGEVVGHLGLVVGAGVLVLLGVGAVTGAVSRSAAA